MGREGSSLQAPTPLQLKMSANSYSYTATTEEVPGETIVLGLSQKIKEEIDEAATEYWINYNYIHGEEWGDVHSEEPNGHIYRGESHL
jgi:hypothetical protein